MAASLELKNLTKYFGKRKVVDDITLSVNSGEVFGFLGPNGAGKTTTIKLVMGFLKPDGGEIIIGGESLSRHYEKAMSYLGGIVENPEMYGYLSGRKNLEMYARLHNGVPKRRVDECLELVGMSGRAGEKVKRYSLGMKQRIGLAQALVHRPKVLILDEPTNGLDPAGIKELRDILKRLAHEEDVAVMVSSHMLSEMEPMCDRVGIIDAGRLIGVRPVHDASGGEKYRFAVDNPSAAAAALEDKTAFRCEITDDMLVVSAQRDSVPDVVALLVSQGIKIYGIGKKEDSLEETFIKITGGGLTIA